MRISEIFALSVCVLVCLLILSGCTKVVTKPQPAYVPIPVACVVKLPQEPIWNTLEAKTGNYPVKVKAMAIDLYAAHQYIENVKKVNVTK